MVEKLDWDSDFFNYLVGKHVVTENENDVLDCISKFNNYNLIYIYSTHFLTELAHLFFEEKIVYFKKIDINKNVETTDCLLFDYLSGYSLDLENLVYLSGEFSRFKLDENFRNGEFKRMYLHWYKLVYSQDSSKNILVKSIDNKPVGFVLYSIQNKELTIELISVFKKNQGKGIAQELLIEVENLGIKNKCLNLRVVTQGINLKARRLYENYGFQLNENMFIYHYWNL